MGLQKIPRWLRISIPLVLIIGWLTAAGIGGPYFGRIDEVSSNDLATFLPESSESTEVNNRLQEFRDSSTIPLMAVFSDNGKELSGDASIQLSNVTRSLSEVEGVAGQVSPALQSRDGQAILVVVPIQADADFETVMPLVREKLAAASTGLDMKLGGPASFAHDLKNAFGAIDVTLLAVALGVVFVILLFVYRSPVLPVVVLLNAMVALASALLLVWHLAKADVFVLNGQVQGILFILVIGAATDYSLLYVARLREEYHRHASKWQATIATLKGSVEPIVAAGGTVAVGLMCLLLSDLGSNQSLGPVGAIGIVFAVLSALTLLPSLLLLFGRKAFWPREPQLSQMDAVNEPQNSRVWPWVGSFVSKNPRRVWVTTAALLVLASVGLFGLKANGVAQSELILGKSESRDAQHLITEHFPGGSGSPVYVIVPKLSLPSSIDKLDSDPGIAATNITVTNSPIGSIPVGKAAEGIPGFGRLDMIQPKVVDGDILLQATLKDEADSQAARDTIVRLRQSFDTANTPIRVGGITAVQHDTIQASLRDRKVILPIILLAITVILALLLRSFVAPLVLLLTTVLSFGAAIGIASLIFNHLWHFPGADPAVILFGFVFLVALGIDYNIFLMTRVREETLRHGVQKGTLRGLVTTGGVITSAGIVLAATFAALGIIPILFLAQLAFIVAFGVLLDTFVVRSLLVPALTLDIGKKMWWPQTIKPTSGKSTAAKGSANAHAKRK